MYSVKLMDAHFWIATIGIVLYVTSMWIAGVMQGLMWRAVNPDGTLTYTFVESVKATYPFYAIRLLGGVLYLSGMLGNTAETKGSAAAQTKETLARVRNALSAAGYAPSDVVDSMVYLTDVSTFAEMNGEYRAFFGKDFPARTTVQSGLVAADGLVEIMMTAVKQ